MGEITYREVDGKTIWSCGCITYVKLVKGQKAFVIETCGDEVCPVLTATHNASGDKNIPVQHFKKEEFEK